MHCRCVCFNLDKKRPAFVGLVFFVFGWLPSQFLAELALGGIAVVLPLAVGAISALEGVVARLFGHGGLGCRHYENILDLEAVVLAGHGVLLCSIVLFRIYFCARSVRLIV